MRIGGIASFIRGFVKYAPDDFEFGMVGVTNTRRPWHWHETELEGRALRFFPILRSKTSRRSRIPLSLRFALSGWRGRIDWQGWLPNLHRPGGDAVLRGYRGPVWRVVHLTREDLTSLGSESRWRGVPRLLDLAEARSFHRMDRIYVVNGVAADMYRARFPSLGERFVFLPNWVDTDLFLAPDAAEVRRRRARLATRVGWPATADVIAFVARLEGQKNPLLLADAFASLHTRRPTVRLLVIGDGSMRRAMEDRLAARGVLDAVRFEGLVARSELAEILPTARCLLITSRFETGPTVGYEALASGVPVVTTRVGEIARIVDASGAGRVVDDVGPEPLARAMDDILASSAATARELAVQAAAPYSAPSILAPVYEYQRELAERVAGP